MYFIRFIHKFRSNKIKTIKIKKINKKIKKKNIDSIENSPYFLKNESTIVIHFKL